MPNRSFAFDQLVDQFKRLKFNPDYVFKKFGLELEPLAFEIISTPNYQQNMYKLLEFEQKIYELIRTDFDSPEGYMANFILNSPYYYEPNTGLYYSGLNSLTENLFSQSNYRFPKFLNSLNNEFEFNSVIYELVQKYAPISMGIHSKLSTQRPGYTWHTLNSEQIHIVAQEAYTIYQRVQRFLQDLEPAQKNFLETTQEMYEQIQEHDKINQTYTVGSKIFSIATQAYREKYKSDPPGIPFGLI
jgi:hypothetical protein